MTNMVEGNITNQYPLTKIRNYYRMGDGIMDGYPIIQDQTSPNLAHIPTTNLFIYSEDFSQSDWNKQNISITPNYSTSPFGTNNATRFLTTSNVASFLQVLSLSILNSTSYTISVYAKSNNGLNKFRFYTSTAGTSSEFTTTSDWQRFEYNITSTGTSSNIGLRGVSGSETDIIIFGFQIEQQSQATAYIKSDGIAAVRKSSTTNLIPYSEDLTQGTTNRLSVTSNATTAPDGTNTADKLIPNNTSSTYHYFAINSLSINSNHRYSVYLKKSEYEYALINFENSGTSGSSKNAIINLNNGNIESTNFTSVSVTNEGNGWYRCSVQATTSRTSIAIYPLPSSNTGSFTGDNTSGIFAWGIQLEEQTQAETYVKTTGLPVTIDLFTENNYGTMTNMVAGDIVEDTP